MIDVEDLFDGMEIDQVEEPKCEPEKKFAWSSCLFATEWCSPIEYGL